MAALEAVVEEVATNLEEVATATRRLNASGIGYFVGGVAVGVAVGVYLGLRWQKEKIRAEAFAESEIEVAKIREAYLARDKPDLEEIVEERGYGHSERIEPEEIQNLQSVRPLPPPVPGIVEPHPRAGEIVEPQPREDDWDWDSELRHRDPEVPYVIHQNEFMHDENGYEHRAYTYYSVDDVMCDDDDEPVPHADMIVGQDNLKFGHGTDDPDVVFIRNQNIEIEIEICRVYKSYEEEVLGHDRNESA